MKLTNEQQKAVEIIDKNVIVNAGAGTGKTEVLTRRYVEILEKGKLEKDNEISGIVAITFTIKAANEMKERIKALLHESENKKNNNFLKQLNESNISTIHGFCSKIIRENSYYLNIDPLFEILEEKESNEILDRVIFNIFNPEGKQEQFISKLMNLANINEVDEVVYGIKNIYLKIKNTVVTVKEIKDITLEKVSKLNSYNKNLVIIDELNYILENLKLRSNSKLLKFINNESNSKIFNNAEYLNIDFLVNLQESIKSLDKNEDLDHLREIIEEQLQYEEKKNIDIYEKIFKSLELIDLEYNLEKQKLGKYDFNDLEHLTYKLLQNPKIKSKIQEDIKYVMVDEYQDSNDIQKEIFYLICSKEKPLDRNNLFVVGDPKQSIYGFRGANINIFNETRRNIKNTSGEDITFTTNYRSNDKLMSGINNIYSNIMKDRYDILNPSKVSKDNYNIFSLNNDNKRDSSFEPKAISNYIASNIKEGKRKAKNYTLLFRSRSGQELFEENLRNRNIPFYTFDSLGFYNSEEIQIIIEIFKLVKDISNDQSLYFIMKSQIYKVSDEDIFEYLNNGSEDIEKTNSEIFFKIKYLKELVNNSVSSILNNIYDIFNLYELYNFEENNIQKQGNLYKLNDIAKIYDENNLTFDDFCFDLINNSNDETMKQVEDENSEVVKLMTIHGSKGLGFDDVVIPYINKGKSNKKDLVKFRKENGLAINFYGANYTYKELEKLDLEEENIENNNIYYVAMTRAKENLMLGFSGFKSGYKKVIYEDIEALKNSNLIKEIQAEEEIVLDIKKREDLNETEEFLYAKNIESSKNNIIKSNITTVLKYYNNKNNLIDLKDIDIKEYELTEEKDNLKLPGYLTGNIVHRYAELYKEPYNVDLKDVLTEFGVGKDQEVFFKRYIENFKNLFNYSATKSLEEVEFNYKYKNFLFRGIIDRIEIEKNTLRIIDYKFSNLQKKELISRYWIQIVFYGLVCEQLFKDYKVELVLKNIKNNYLAEIEYNTENKNSLLNIIDNYINDINKPAEI